MGVAKVPVIMQLEALECGAASLAMIMAYYGKWIPIEQVRSDCGVSRDGSNAKNIYLAAQNYGMKVHGYTMEVEAIRTQATYPCMIHWNFHHFVVLDGFSGNRAVLNDPARGQVKVSMEEFNRSFTGICLTDKAVVNGGLHLLHVDAQSDGGVGLRVGIDEQHTLLKRSKRGGQVHRRRCLAHTTFLIG